MTTAEKRVLTVEEAGALYGLGKSASYQAVARGDIPGVIRIGRRILLSAAAIERHLEHGGNGNED